MLEVSKRTPSNGVIQYLAYFFGCEPKIDHSCAVAAIAQLRYPNLAYEDSALGVHRDV